MEKKIKYIAEISSNHNSSLRRCKKFIDIAKMSGFDSVKFQLFKLEKLFHSSILKKSKKHRDRKKWELTEKFLPILSSHAKKNGLNFGCTPFYYDAIDILEPYVDFFKIASYELLRLDLIERCIQTKKHIIFSIGMANQKEVIEVLKLFKKKKYSNFSIMACSSIYPTEPNECNLNNIITLRNLINSMGFKKDVKVGWSDHSRSEAVLYRAFHKFNIEMLEVHIDLDGQGFEYQSKHCWLPDEISKIFYNINQGATADGNYKINPRKREKNERNWRADPTDGLRPIKKIRKN
jgi:sialic acid synthase SpsE